MTIWSYLGRGLAPFASSSILDENRMMDSGLTEAYFIWHAQSIFSSFGNGLCRKSNEFHYSRFSCIFFAALVCIQPVQNKSKSNASREFQETQEALVIQEGFSFPILYCLERN
jgi:hypothetical protein